MVENSSGQGKLDSWKEIAAYLDRHVSTLQRWERKEGLPVHRHLHHKKASVYAYPSEIDAWLENRRIGKPAASESVTATVPAKKPSSLWLAMSGVAVLPILAALAFFWPFVPTPAREDINSVAVLPFQDPSGDPDLEYISNGVAEGITHRLSQLPHLDKVVSSASLKRYKGKEVDAQTVSREIGARALVMGSIVQLGKDIRISVELVDGENNSALWGGSYTRPRSSLYEMEEYFAPEIADALGIQLMEDEEDHLRKHYTENSEAHDSYLRGMNEMARFTAEGVKRSISFFEKAIERDPDYAAAYVKLARSYIMLGITRVLPPAEIYPKVADLAKKALQIDVTIGEAHAHLAFLDSAYFWDWEEAERQAKLAIKLDPHSANAHVIYARFLGMMGRFDEAIPLARRAQQLAPFELNLQAAGANILYQARRYDESIKQIKRVRETNLIGWPSLTRTYEATEQYGAAVAAYQEALKKAGASREDITGVADAYQTSGAEGYWRWRLNHSTEQASQEYVPHIAFAEIHAALGERDLAFEELEKAYQERDTDMAGLKVEPRWDPLRSDPRFQALLQRMNLEP